jgi:uncharacterized membrane protein
LVRAESTVEVEETLYRNAQEALHILDRSFGRARRLRTVLIVREDLHEWVKKITLAELQSVLVLLAMTQGWGKHFSKYKMRGQQMPVAVVIVSSLASIVAFLYLIDHLARGLRPVSVVSQVGRDGARVIESIYPELLGPASVEAVPSTPDLDDAPPRQVVLSRTGGVVLAVDLAGLVADARAADGRIELVPQVGDFVAKGDPLFRVRGDGAPLDEELLGQRIVLGAERTIEQDPAFPLRIIVDIASKALSPAINDPTTAVLALDQLHHLLRNLGQRRLDTGLICDRDQRQRLAYRTPDWENFVDLAVTEIRLFGAGSIQVARRLRAMLEDLIMVLPPLRRPPLQAELLRLQRSAQRAFVDPDDQERAKQGDSQGLGGHQ